MTTAAAPGTGSAPSRDLRVLSVVGPHRAACGQALARRDTWAPGGTGSVFGDSACTGTVRGSTAAHEVTSGFRLVHATNPPSGRAEAAHPPCSLPGFDARYITVAVVTPWPCWVRWIRSGPSLT
jgi:hypothetical protein